MRRAALALVGAVVLAALAFDAAPGAAGIALVLGSLGLSLTALALRPEGWGARIALALLVAYLAGWGVTRFEVWRLTGTTSEELVALERDKRERVAAALERRLAEDRDLAVRVAARLVREDPLGPLEQDTELFVRLGRAAPAETRPGVGLELYDTAGSLRAWWGDPRGERVPPDSVALAVEREIVRRPSGFTIVHVGATWITPVDTFRLLVKDLWAVESPLGRDVAERGLLLSSLAEREDLTLRVHPGEGASGSVVRGGSGEVVATLESERFLVDRFLAGRRSEAGRALAVLLLWPLAWAIGAVWSASDPRGSDRAGGKALALGRRAVALIAVWAFFVETRYLATFLPASWFSPLAFAEASYGPAGRSPGDFLVTAALLALFAISAWTLRPRGDVGKGRVAGVAGVAAVAIGAGLSAGVVEIGAPAIERALAGMSPPVFFSPTLLFTPPFLMVLLGFGLLAAIVVLALAAGFDAAGVRTTAGWAAAAGGAAAVAIIVVARRLPEAAMAGTRGDVAPLLAIALAGAAVVVLVLGRDSGRRGEGAPIWPGLAAVAFGAMVALPLAAHARVQAAQELLVERAERIGPASSQWVSYTIDRTVEFLVRDPGIARAIESGNRDAALLLWSRSPLRELDFATGLYLLDADGEIVSRFSLASRSMAERARQMAAAVRESPIAVAGTQDESGVRWAVVPVFEGEERVGTVVAMTTGAVELRAPVAGASFVLTDLLTGPGAGGDLPGYTVLEPGVAPPPRTLLTAIRQAPAAADEAAGTAFLAMPLEPLLPGARGWAVFALVGALAGLVLATIERAMHERARAGWAGALRRHNPLRSFRVQLLVAFLAIAFVPLAIAAFVGYRHTRFEIEEFTRRTAAESLESASRMLAGDEALARGTARALGDRLRDLADVLQQDVILYWRGRTVASSRPEIFSSRLFADRMEGSVYAELFAGREPLVFDATTLGDRSFLVAYRALAEPDPAAEYVLATPLLLREDRARVELERLGEGIFLLTALSLLFLAVVGWGLARFMAGPLAALETGTRHIAAGRLSYRLPEPARSDEFGRLQRAFNAMAARLDTGQRALEREKSRVQAILASVGAGVVALDADGRVRLLNERAATLLDQSSDAVVDRTVEELADAGGAAAPFWREVAREVMAGQRADRDLVLRKGGDERHYHVVCTGLRDGAGAERGLVVAFEDITDNVQSQRVLAWGEMARQVAHEIKNPLTPMKLSLQHLERIVGDRAPEFEEALRQNLDLVLAEIARLERIAGSFARFAIPRRTAPEPVDAVAVARDVVALYGSGDEGVTYEVEVAGDPAPVMAEREGLRRVVVNLVENAREAVEGDGSGVTVRLDFTGDPDRARISVIDDGSGLPEGDVERLFEPSFSTKTRGTGLGLAMSRRIVESWGGSIAWERRRPRGTAMHVTLRRAGGGGPAGREGREGPARR